MKNRNEFLHMLPVWAGYALVATLLAGVGFHTAERPVLLGKYAAADILFAVALLGWALVWKRLLQFICKETIVKGPEGRERKI